MGSMVINHSSLPQFVAKLFSILDDPRYSNFIRWGPEGKSFVILDPTEFSNGVLSEHFKHSNMSSFVRQLNKYDFHKVKSDESTRMKYGNSMWEFAHRNFRKDRMDLIMLISRKKSSLEKHNSNNEIKEYEEFNSHSSSFQGYIANSIATISKYFEMISEDIATIKSILQERQGPLDSPRLRILVAEDNASCAVYATMILKRSNVNVVSVESVNDLTYEYHNNTFDMIIISSAIPDVNEIINELRKYDPVVPIILTIEASNKPNDLYSIYPAVTKILFKPYSHEDLLGIVEKFTRVGNKKAVEDVNKKCQKRFYY